MDNITDMTNYWVKSYYNFLCYKYSKVIIDVNIPKLKLMGGKVYPGCPDNNVTFNIGTNTNLKQFTITNNGFKFKDTYDNIEREIMIPYGSVIVLCDYNRTCGILTLYEE